MHENLTRVIMQAKNELEADIKSWGFEVKKIKKKQKVQDKIKCMTWEENK